MVGHLIGLTMMYRCFQMYKFHFTARLNDDILSIIVILFLIMYTFLIVSAKHLLGLHNNTSLKFMTCLKMEVIDIKDDM